MGRTPCCDHKKGLKKGPWTPEEDQKLIDYIRLHSPGNWRTLPKNAGLQRCGKSCRLRWKNYLRPDIKRGRFSFEEEETIIQLHSVLGNKWSAIAARLPGRTDNEIKNHWNTHIRKRLLRNGIDPVTHAPRLDLLYLSPLLNAALCNQSNVPSLQNLLSSQTGFLNPESLKLASLLFSLKQENLQQNQLQNLVQLLQQNQVQNPLSQDIPTSCPTTNFSNQEPPGQQATTDLGINGFSSNDVMENFPSQNPQEFGLGSQTPCYEPDSSNLESSNLPSLTESFDFYSLMSTPASSPTPLNSSSTFMNSNEEERESNCSSLFKFEIPESFDICDFI